MIFASGPDADQIRHVYWVLLTLANNSLLLFSCCSCYVPVSDIITILERTLTTHTGVTAVTVSGECKYGEKL